jgi:uncharacterized membrane protein
MPIERISVTRSKPRKESRNLSDLVAKTVGSWKFVISLTLLTTFWVAWNTTAPKKLQYDPFPFILLNLTYSFLAGYTGPVLLMASNRQSEVDRKRSVDHYLIDVHDSQTLEEMAIQLEEIHRHVEHSEEHL